MSKIKAKHIQGSGGGGGKGGGGGTAHIPVESADSLQSKAFAQVMDLVCEGEIEGLVDGLKSVYLDGTPIENPSGSVNFTGVTFESRVGSQDQDYITQFPAVENEVAVGIRVTKTAEDDTGIVRTITNEAIDAIRVRISIPQLSYQNPSTGDLGGSEVEYFVELQSDGGGYNEIVRDIVIGKTTSKYERAYRIDLDGPGPWDIRVRRATLDSEEANLQNATVWESYTEIIDGKLRYPNSAISAMRVDASQFSSIPTRGYDVKLLKIQIPANATVRDDGSLTYSGEWDGTFQVAWSANPAWCFYDLLTNTRYGLGNFIDADLVDKWGLYTIGQYCDELVTDGFGGTEPRFLCNLYLQTRAEAFRVLQDMASIFRAMTYWAEGAITVVQDSPQDPAHLFTPANVVDGMFNYAGSSAKARHTVAVVTWNDPDNLYQQQVEYVEDQESIARYGIIETEVIAFGCTSQGQAHRLGRWLLYSERFQTETVVFKTGLGGSICRPGQIIQIADPVRAGSRRGGRVASATDSVVVLDAAIDVPPSTHTISLVLPDGTVETRQLLIVDGDTVTVATETEGSPFSAEAVNAAIWMIQSTAVDSQQFRVISVSESDEGTYEVNAISHNPDKFDAVENELTIEPRSVSALTSIPSAPAGLLITETLYAIGADVRTKVTISWNYVTGATGYLVQWQRDDGNIISMPETSLNEVEILNAEPGFYSVTVYAVNSIGKRSESSSGTKEILGRAGSPNEVSGFSLIPLAGVAYLSWTKSTDLDVLIGGFVRIRYSPDIVTPVWKSAVDITPALAGTATRAQVPLLPGTYMAKFVDSSGVASDDAATIVTTVPEAHALNVVETLTEHPLFEGVKTDCFITESFGGGLIMSPAGLVDDIPDIDEVVLWDFYGGVVAEATYEFNEIVDLGEKFTSRVTAAIECSAIDVTETIDERIDPIDEWVDLDGDFIDQVNGELFVSTSDDGVEYSVWKRFFVGEYAARYFKFKLVMTSLNPAYNFLVSGLSVEIDMPDRVVNVSMVSSGAGVYNLVYDEAFNDVPAIGITAHNLNTGDFWEITNNTREGFDIEFKDSADAAVSRTFDVLAKGYGRQLS